MALFIIADRNWGPTFPRRIGGPQILQPSGSWCKFPIYYEYSTEGFQRLFSFLTLQINVSILVSISSTFYGTVFCMRVLSYIRQSQNVTREKLCKALLYEKGTCKMLMKLTPGSRSCKAFNNLRYYFLKIGQKVSRIIWIARNVWLFTKNTARLMFRFSDNFSCSGTNITRHLSKIISSHVWTNLILIID